MSWHNIVVAFNPLPNDGLKRFVWNGTEWWRWFTGYRRKPSAESIYSRLAKYDYFMSFHAARPADVSSFYTKGIELADADVLNRRAREVLVHPKITQEALEKAIHNASRIHDKTLFLTIDERDVSGHYLIYGSEHICGIAASMYRDVPLDCRQLLKNFGTPTLFRVALPRIIIPDHQLRELANSIRRICWDERKRDQPPRIDFSWILKESVPPEYVFDHVHPESIPDPLLQYVPYNYRINAPSLV